MGVLMYEDYINKVVQYSHKGVLVARPARGGRGHVGEVVQRDEAMFEMQHV